MSTQVRKGRPLTADALLAGHSEAVRRLTESLRGLMRSVVPEAVERVNLGWHSLGYRHPEFGYFGGIFPHDDFVKVGFEYGAFLPDPEGLLEGTGKQLRYYVVRDEADIRSEALAALLRASLKPRPLHLMARR